MHFINNSGSIKKSNNVKTFRFLANNGLWKKNCNKMVKTFVIYDVALFLCMFTERGIKFKVSYSLFPLPFIFFLSYIYCKPTFFILHFEIVELILSPLCTHTLTHNSCCSCSQVFCWLYLNIWKEMTSELLMFLPYWRILMALHRAVFLACSCEISQIPWGNFFHKRRSIKGFPILVPACFPPFLTILIG